MRKLMLLVPAILLFLASAAIGQSNGAVKAGNLSSQDQQFAKIAAQANLGEVDLGKMAQDRGSSALVKQFGKLMVNDHSKAQDDLKNLMAGAAFTLPNAPAQKETSLKSSLSKASGKDFDEAYVRDMLQGHKDVVAAFERETREGQDPALKAFAVRVLPTIEDHIRIAEDIAGRLGLAGAAGLHDKSKAITAMAKPSPY